MPRKKHSTASAESEATSVATLPAIEQPSAQTAAVPPAYIDGPPVDETGQIIREGSPRPSAQMRLSDVPSDEPARESGDDQPARNWGDPYKSIFSCKEMGFELGENRRYKQRVFRFSEKPSAEILDTLKAHGFIYRAAEKAWTLNATPDARKLTDELARQWAGPAYVQGFER